MSVRIKYGNDKPSLAKRILGSYGTKNATADEESESNLLDLENPLLGDHGS